VRPTRLYAHVRTHDWFAVTIDFLIVVLGVYVAVWVSSQQAAREREQRTGKVVAALRQDLRDSIAVDQKFDRALDRAFAAFARLLHGRRETPRPGVRIAHGPVAEWRSDIATQNRWARCLDDRLSEPSKAGPSCRPSIGGTIDVGRPK
jgi:hypothetical protein